MSFTCSLLDLDCRVRFALLRTDEVDGDGYHLGLKRLRLRRLGHYQNRDPSKASPIAGGKRRIEWILGKSKMESKQSFKESFFHQIDCRGLHFSRIGNFSPKATAMAWRRL
uniref:Uncharacterized protein n=1 Tax=Gossypium raimondii TaxID=29730 RepID=A0A0D2R657_GOSRA|nr:hypothetical protein B456_008G172700 [Gossypium raimondii]